MTQRMTNSSNSPSMVRRKPSSQVMKTCWPCTRFALFRSSRPAGFWINHLDKPCRIERMAFTTASLARWGTGPGLILELILDAVEEFVDDTVGELDHFLAGFGIELDLALDENMRESVDH